MNTEELAIVIDSCNTLFYALDRKVIDATMFSKVILLDVHPDELRELADGAEVTKEPIDGKNTFYSFEFEGWTFRCVWRDS